MSKVIFKYTDIMKNGVFTERDIIGFRRTINGCSRLDDSLKRSLHNIFQTFAPYRITKEQTHKGINYLKSKAFTKAGKPRETKDYPFKQRHLDIIDNFSKFRFVRLFDISQNSFENNQPVYRVIAKNGDYFDYIAHSFGQIEVL